jgi:hypothetical protein
MTGLAVPSHGEYSPAEKICANLMDFARCMLDEDQIEQARVFGVTAMRAWRNEANLRIAIRVGASSDWSISSVRPPEEPSYQRAEKTAISNKVIEKAALTDRCFVATSILTLVTNVEDGPHDVGIVLFNAAQGSVFRVIGFDFSAYPV